jgi:hypothetical protein
MEFMVPIASFDSVHRSSSTAPRCVIRVVIQCEPADCDVGAMGVRVEDRDSREVLARGRVRCTGGDEPHDLQMEVQRPLSTVSAQLVFECGGEEERSLTNMIWVQCS